MANDQHPTTLVYVCSLWTPYMGWVFVRPCTFVPCTSCQETRMTSCVSSTNHVYKLQLYWLLLLLLMRWVIFEINIFFYTLTHLYKSALKCFFKYLDSTSTPTMSYSTMCVSLSSGHKVRFWLNTHRVPSKSHSWEVCGHVQFTTWQGKHFVRSNDGNVPGEQRIHDFFINGKPLGSVSTAYCKKKFQKDKLSFWQ